MGCIFLLYVRLHHLFCVVFFGHERKMASRACVATGVDSAERSADQGAGGEAGAVEGASREFTVPDHPAADGV